MPPSARTADSGRTASLRRRFIVIATGLHNFTGHEYQYTASVIRRIDRSEFGVEVWGRRDPIRELAEWPEYRGVFSRRAYSQAVDGFVRNMWNLVQRERVWFREVRQALEQADLQTGDTIFVHTFSTYSLWQWVALQGWLERRQVHLLLVLRYSPLIVTAALRPLYKLLYTLLRGGSGYMHLLADSQELVEEYQSIAPKPFTVIPIPVETAEYSNDTLMAAGSEIVVLYPGSARTNKGFHLLPDVVESINGSDVGSRVRFCFQVTPSGADVYEPECAVALDRLRRLRDRYANIELIETHPDPSSFACMIRAARIVLLPYTVREYRTQTSGLAAEAIACGNMVIVPAGTWLARQVSEVGWGEVFDPAETSALVDATSRAVSRILGGEAIAVGAYDRFRRSNNPERLVEIIGGVTRW